MPGSAHREVDGEKESGGGNRAVQTGEWSINFTM